MIKEKVNALFETYGYRKFKMSKFEPYDLYADNRDFLKSSQVITFTDLDGSLLALKPDVTLSIVKANGGGAEKVYYNETVYRPKDNHYREIPQAGAECIGEIDSYIEGEVIALAAKAMALIDKDNVVRVSDAAFLQLVFERMQLAPSVVEEILGLFSRKNSTGLNDLTEKGKISADDAELLGKLMEIYLPFEKGAALLSQYAVTDEEKKRAAYLNELISVLDGFGVLSHIFMDFSLVNSMDYDYYNGLIFQGAARGIAFPVLSGGRYDRLPEKMGKKVGAIGFALYLDIIENNLPSLRMYDADYLITYTENDSPATLAATVEKLVANGYGVRTMKETELDRMEYRIRVREIVSLEKLLKERRL
ncbi:MAG: ATP phosphoribosyltransferase regulatory subunit [Eubacteriales bacterium]|nr:ATP phosphoribosyltransferase regulatory subunit [Eubacteriales bacterium]